jgi:hypothetical protein
MLSFDHLAIGAETLDEGVEAVEAALGVPLAPGGGHPAMGTHNRLLSLGPGEYLEVIAIDPDAPARPAALVRARRLSRPAAPQRLDRAHRGADAGRWPGRRRAPASRMR